MTQTVMTFIAAIRPSKLADLKAILEIIHNDPAQNRVIPFGKLRSLHFSSMVIFARPDLEPILVWENNFDGTLDAYIDAQLGVASEGLDHIYQCCQNYVGRGALKEYLRAHAVPAGLYYIGAPGRTVRRIKDEAFLRARLQEYLGQVSTESATAAARQIRELVRQNAELLWAAAPEPGQSAADKLVAWVRLLFTSLLLVMPTLLAVVPVATMLRRKEAADHEDHDPIPSGHLRRLLADEDRNILNHMASITRVKPGKLRLLILRLILWSGNIFARTQYKGTLAGIPGIHYAHWSLIDQGRWLLFLTNYAGSWTSYLDDFIERASGNLSAIWSNTGGFPRTRLLIFGGARNALLFKTYARNSQAETLVWYSAYPNLTTRNINRNTDIRNGLYGDVKSEREERMWLHAI